MQTAAPDCRLFDFLTTLSHADSADAALATTFAFMCGLGASHLSFTMGLEGDDPILRWTSPAWVSEYWKEKLYPDHAPLIRHCRENLTPAFTGREFECSNAGLSTVRRHYLEEIASEGIRAMVATPVHAQSRRDSGFLNFATDLGAAEFKRMYGEQAITIHLAAMAAFSRVQGLIRKEQAARIGLTPRERECLLWLARGLRNIQIADRLNIKPVTVAFHLANAHRKLAAHTRNRPSLSPSCWAWFAPRGQSI